MTHKKEEYILGAKNSFLMKFFNDKISNYIEPERKGTPKGQDIGFSLQAYAASLLMLTNNTQEHIAKLLKIPVGTLRKWNMKESFFDLQVKHAQEFVALVDKHARCKYLKYSHSYHKYLDGRTNSHLPEPTWEEFDDTYNYGDILREEVVEHFDKTVEHLKKNTTDNDTHYYLWGFLYRFLIEVVGISKSARSKENNLKALIRDIKVMVRNAKSILSKKRQLNKSDKRHLVMNVNAMDSFIDTMASFVEEKYFKAKK